MPTNKYDLLIINSLKTMKKISLKEFQFSKLTLSERLNVKGGSGGTRTRRIETRTVGTDCDSQRYDSDC